jgi:hypothetical protein
LFFKSYAPHHLQKVAVALMDLPQFLQNFVLGGGVGTGVAVSCCTTRKPHHLQKVAFQAITLPQCGQFSSATATLFSLGGASSGSGGSGAAFGCSVTTGGGGGTGFGAGLGMALTAKWQPQCGHWATPFAISFSQFGQFIIIPDFRQMNFYI